MRVKILPVLIGLLFVCSISYGQSISRKYSLLKELVVAENFARLKITSGDYSPEQLYAAQAFEHAYHARDILDVLQYKDSISTENYKRGQQIVTAFTTLVSSDKREKSGQLSLLYFMTSTKLEAYFTELSVSR